jgi:hypothetical protein
MNKYILKQMRLKRQYTITCDMDRINIQNGRCPDYAVRWGFDMNPDYWDEGHDYFIGNQPFLTTEPLELLREILSERLKKGQQDVPIIFCDLDGVLADFEKGVYKIFNKPPYEIQTGLMWSAIRKCKTFFENLEWMHDGKELWKHIKNYNPIILTGVPYGIENAALQKLDWCARELGPEYRVITCKTDDKPKYCIVDSILIDDRDKIKSRWIVKLGKFILHKNTYKTLEILEETIKNKTIP